MTYHTLYHSMKFSNPVGVSCCCMPCSRLVIQHTFLAASLASPSDFAPVQFILPEANTCTVALGSFIAIVTQGKACIPATRICLSFGCNMQQQQDITNRVLPARTQAGLLHQHGQGTEARPAAAVLADVPAQKACALQGSVLSRAQGP